MFKDTVPLQDRKFSTLHEIVFGLNGRDIQQYLASCSQINIDETDQYGRTALAWASARGDLYMVESLLTAGADTNIIPRKGKAALQSAVVANHADIVQKLLQHGADINQRNASTRATTLKAYCTVNVDHASWKLLVKMGADLEALDLRPNSPLMWISEQNRADSMELMVGRAADAENLDSIGSTVFLDAVMSNHHAVLHVLLQNKIDARILTRAGRNILHLAAHLGDAQTLSMMAAARLRGLRLHQRSIYGATASDLAQHRSHEGPEWHAAWAALAASVGEEEVVGTHAAGQGEEGEQENEEKEEACHPNAGVVWRYGAAVAAAIVTDLAQIHGYFSRLSMPPKAVFRAAALFVAILLYTLCSVYGTRAKL
jgi:ankyrin repeat protein